MKEIMYAEENDLSAKEFRDILIRSTLGARRPVDDSKRLERMCRNANLIITARINGRLIGVSRSLTDFAYCTYLSDLAVDEEYQKRGIGKRLIYETKLRAPQASLILLAAPGAVDYYPKIGMQSREHCFWIKDISELK